MILSQALPWLGDLRCATTFSELQFIYLYRRQGHECSKTEIRACQTLAPKHAWQLLWQPLAWPSPQLHPHAPTAARPSLPETAATSALLTLTADREALPRGKEL